MFLCFCAQVTWRSVERLIHVLNRDQHIHLSEKEKGVTGRVCFFSLLLRIERSRELEHKPQICLLSIDDLCTVCYPFPQFFQVTHLFPRSWRDPSGGISWVNGKVEE